MPSKRAQLGATLDAIEQELRHLELWDESEQAPANLEHACQSPFGVGEIEFHTWLQFVLLERLRALLATEAALPETMLVHTYAQEFYRGQWGRYRQLISLLQKMDSIFLS